MFIETPEQVAAAIAAMPNPVTTSYPNGTPNYDKAVADYMNTALYDKIDNKQARAIIVLAFPVAFEAGHKLKSKLWKQYAIPADVPPITDVLRQAKAWNLHFDVNDSFQQFTVPQMIHIMGTVLQVKAYPPDITDHVAADELRGLYLEKIVNELITRLVRRLKELRNDHVGGRRDLTSGYYNGIVTDPVTGKQVVNRYTYMSEGKYLVRQYAAFLTGGALMIVGFRLRCCKLVCTYNKPLEGYMQHLWLFFSNHKGKAIRDLNDQCVHGFGIADVVLRSMPCNTVAQGMHEWTIRQKDVH